MNIRRSPSEILKSPSDGPGNAAACTISDPYMFNASAQVVVMFICCRVSVVPIAGSQIERLRRMEDAPVFRWIELRIAGRDRDVERFGGISAGHRVDVVVEKLTPDPDETAQTGRGFN